MMKYAKRQLPSKEPGAKIDAYCPIIPKSVRMTNVKALTDLLLARLRKALIIFCAVEHQHRCVVRSVEAREGYH